MIYCEINTVSDKNLYRKSNFLKNKEAETESQKTSYNRTVSYLLYTKDRRKRRKKKQRQKEQMEDKMMALHIVISITKTSCKWIKHSD